MDFRAEFQRDVIIDMYAYRRWGHNEADEPSFTQPLVYKAIEHRPSIRDSYLKHLLDLGKVTEEEADQIADQERDDLEQQFNEAKKVQPQPQPLTPSPAWKPFFGGREPDEGPETGVPVARLKSLMERIALTPDGFHLHKKLLRSIERRQKMAKGEEPLDWSAAEALAIASLAVEGHPVRLTGQDSVRGTFSQRHAVLLDVVDGHRYEVFQHLADDQAPVNIINSPLCETATMGYEYGYSLDYPEALVLWEAQYGDFVNAAQVIIDQFIVSAEDKWRRFTGLGLLLPHAFEGKGPEHSSARLERFLALGGRRQFASRLSLDTGSVFPLPASPGETQMAEATCRAHAEELVAASACDVVAGRPGQRPLPPHPGRHACGRRRDKLRAAHQRQNVLRPRRSARETRAATTSPSFASNSSTRCATKCSPTHCETMPTERRSAGCKKSRKTWAPGPTGRSASADACSNSTHFPLSPGPHRPARPPAPPPPTTANKNN